MTGSRRRAPVARGTKCKHCGHVIHRDVLFISGDKVWVHAGGNIYCPTNLPGLTAKFAEPA